MVLYGECDGTDLQHTLQEAGWSYVVWTGSHGTASWQGVPFRLDTVGWCIARDPRRVPRGCHDTGGVWSHSAPLLLGKRV